MKGMKLLACVAGLLAGIAHADERDVWMFAQWAGDHPTRAFRQMLVDARLYGVVPIHQLLRSASDWRLCRASPFAVPPATQWPQVRATLMLLKTLDEQGILRQFEVVSAYRDPRLNACAGGAVGSAHTGLSRSTCCCLPGPTPTRCAGSGSSMARPGTWAWGATLPGASTSIRPAIAPGAATAARGRRSAPGPGEPGTPGIRPPPTRRSAGACCRHPEARAEQVVGRAVSQEAEGRYQLPAVQFVTDHQR